MASVWHALCISAVSVRSVLPLGRTLPAKAPILITKDEPVVWISEHRQKLSEFYEIALPSPETVHILMDKTRFDQEARARGWPMPRTWRVGGVTALKEIQTEIIFPSILKPFIKNGVFRLNSPQKAFKVENAQQLFDCYNMVAQWEDVIIQEWIPGATTALRSVWVTGIGELNRLLCLPDVR